MGYEIGKKGMPVPVGYGILQRYGLSLHTKSVGAKSHGLLQIMGCQRDGL